MALPLLESFVAEGQHGERWNFQLAPATQIIQSGFDVFRFRGIEHRPVFAAVSQRQRLVSLDEGNGPGIEPRGQHGAHLAATQAQGFAEASAVDGSVGCEAVGQPEKQLTVHLGIARQTEPAGTDSSRCRWCRYGYR